jgi:hypothetical protein
MTSELENIKAGTQRTRRNIMKMGAILAPWCWRRLARLLRVALTTLTTLTTLAVRAVVIVS